MAEDKFEQAKGNIKETVGNATDNKELEKDGKGDKASGKAKEAVENVKKKQMTLLINLKVIKVTNNSPYNLALMYSKVYEGLFVYISK